MKYTMDKFIIPSKKYKLLNLVEKSQNPNCGICLEDFYPRSQVRKSKYCQHYFHRLCYDQWIKTIKFVECPICRSHPPGLYKPVKANIPIHNEIDDNRIHIILYIRNLCIAFMIYLLYIAIMSQ